MRRRAHRPPRRTASASTPARCCTCCGTGRGVVVDVQNGLPFGSSAGDPPAGGRPGPPRAPGAVADRVRPARRSHRLVDRVRGRTAALPRAAVTSRCPRPRPRSWSSLGVDADRLTVVPQRRRAGPAGRGGRARPHAAPGRPRPARPAQAGGARDRGASPGCATAGPACACRSSARAGGTRSCGRAPIALGVDRPSSTSTGHVDEQAKHEELARAWVHLCPSVKEGWGLVVTEAGAHRVPTVGYRSAGGLRESVVDGRTGVLVDDLDEMTEAVDRLLADEAGPPRDGRGGGPSCGGVQLAGEHQGLRRRAVRRGRAGGQPRFAVVQDVDRCWLLCSTSCPGRRQPGRRRRQRPRASSHRRGR